MNEPNRIIRIARDTFLQEAAALSAIAASVNESFVRAVDAIAACKGRVIISGVGKSALVAQKIVATFNSTGTPAIFMHAADAAHGDMGMIQPADIVILISKSGESPEIKNLLPTIQEWGNLLIAITGKIPSQLSRYADTVLDTTIGREACPNNLAPTTSTTAQMVMGDALAVALMTIKHFSREDFARLHPGGNLGKRLTLTIAQIYPQNAKPAVKPDTPLKETINIISHGRLGAAAVVDDASKVTGIITDGDVRRLLQRVNDISSIRAGDLSSKAPKTVKADCLAVDALERMKKYDITQLIVTDDQSHFLGIVHLHDLVKEGLA